jgi:hypothetical protein
MARRKPDPVKQAVERQTGACRALAMAMRSHADSLGRFSHREATIVHGFAEIVESIANGLVEAIAEVDQPKLRRMWQWAKDIALPLTVAAAITGGVEGGVYAYTSSVADNSRVVSCAEAVVQNADTDARHVIVWGAKAPATDESGADGPAAGVTPLSNE